MSIFQVLPNNLTSSMATTRKTEAAAFQHLPHLSAGAIPKLPPATRYLVLSLDDQYYQS